ncbi:hypothetical protein [Pseudomonas sp. 31 E 6]|uniref:hypothetical protein n=1 Tax=unclassified Pseudomonas TaxID=196821 RepID=UPI000811D751|nr:MULTISPECIES: hypothetical protein [unclassified Pseudomonas]CRM40178.1 hypothetical protein [Pseudomonas sp. 31 E 5]CRM72874.1 hypothetical protein [Pseudomonas sp. 31 E 6]
MDEPLLREIAERYLLPFFSGARLDPQAEKSSTSEKTVAFVVNQQTIGFKVNKHDGYRLHIRRDQSFSAATSPAGEFNLIQAFIDCLSSMEGILTQDLKDEFLSTFQRRVIAKAIAPEGKYKTILSAIDQISIWASRLYEGAPICSAIGISPDAENPSSITLQSIGSSDFGAVLSNGIDTLLEFNKNLEFVKHHVLDLPSCTEKISPWRHRAIAEWTNGAVGRIALVLNRLGEILIFIQGQLLFARRSGTWHFLTHDPVVSQMSVPKSPDVRQAIYETLLDASFARTGACVGVVRHRASQSWTELVNKGDRLDSTTSDKAATIQRIIGGRLFHELPRTLRQELVAIDGSTVMDHTGKVLAVGAILKLPGGSTSGGRTAAAIELGKLGLGVKVSQDGGITGYLHAKDRDKDKDISNIPAFRTM